MPSSPLTRRSALRAAGSSIVAAIAGCAAAPESDDERPGTADSGRSPASTITESPDTITETSTSSRTPTASPTPDLSSITSEDFAFDVTVDDQFTDEHPARLVISLENVSDQLMTVDSPESPFGVSLGDHIDLDAQLRLLPFDRSRLSTVPRDARFVPREPVDGCWTVDYTLRRSPILIVGEVPPGEPIEMAYTLLDHDNDRCLPAGTYEFSRSKRTRPGGLRHRTDHDFASVAFRFDLDVAEDGAVSVDPNEPRIDD